MLIHKELKHLSLLLGITAIEKDWLPLLVPSEMQFMNTDPEKLDSAPWFDNQSGHVMCRNSGTFGKER